MKKIFEKGFVLFVTVSVMVTGLALCFTGVYAADNQNNAVTNGTCGNHAAWTYDTDAKELTIKGTGEIKTLNSDYLKKNAEKLIIEEGITEIASGIFAEYNFITVQFPESLKTIDGAAFYGCAKLREIIIPKGVEFIGEDAFGACSGLEKFTILGNIKTEGSLFAGDCPTILEIAGKVDKIGQILLNGEETVLPKKITFINNNPYYKQVGNYVLSGDGTKLLYYIGFADKIEIPESVTIIEDYALFYKGIKQVTFNKKLQKIGDYAFYHNSIKTIKLPKKLKSVGTEAFARNGLRKVKFGKNIKKISKEAFAGDNNIKKISLYNHPKIEAGAFERNVKIKYRGKTEIGGSFALADFVTDGKKKDIKLIVNNTATANGYKVKITQPGTGKKLVVHTKKRKVAMNKKFALKTRKGNDYTLKDKYALYVKVRPYKIVKGKKVYGRWSVKTVIR